MDEVRDRAVGLGLLRQPGNDAPCLELTCLAASRLLLAGYRLPAQVVPGSLDELRASLGQGQLVLVPLEGVAPASGDGESVLFQVHCFEPQSPDGPCLSLGLPEAPVDTVRPLPLPRFAEAWEAGGGLLIVAARQWESLPRDGALFFGGSRDPDGTYHWTVAECVTDGEGRILRC
jgi:hypothetical protein